MQAQMDKVKKDSDEMASRFSEEKKRMEAKVEEMEQQMKELLGLVGTQVTIPIYK